jgi:AcrR family transcriptional regulator
VGEEDRVADDERQDPSDHTVAVVRRAPFSDNPRVGARGQRTQQRILDAALRAFADQGYHACSIDRITKVARCSRVSFYQYFASKEDLFRHLAGQVARQVSASTETLDPLTGDVSGWAALRAWVARYAEIHTRYESVFHSIDSDVELATLAGRTGEETIARIDARVASSTLPPRHLDPVIRLLLETFNHTLDVVGILRSVQPDAYPGDQVEVAITDVLHRTLFGLRPDVNVHPPAGTAPPPIPFDAEAVERFRDPAVDEPDAEGGNVALDAILESARGVFVARGYHNTRVDDLVAAAGVSHGAFYRYFRNKEELARLLVARAVRQVGQSVTEIPDLDGLDAAAGAAGAAALRRWLRKYHDAHVHEAAMLRVWVAAAVQDPAIRAESAPPLDWGRRHMSRYLEPRGFGDADTEALVMVALLGVFGSRRRPARELDAAVHIVERGLLGR